MFHEPGSVPMDEPLAYFLTWTTYGSWLPGDPRGWVNKPGDFREPDPSRERTAANLLTESVLTLTVDQRRLVEETIAAHCRIRGWHLHAVNARTQHVHAVVTAPGRSPDDVMDQFKAWCTRKLKERERSLGTADNSVRQNWWTQRGSKRRINKQQRLVRGNPVCNRGARRANPAHTSLTRKRRRKLEKPKLRLRVRLVSPRLPGEVDLAAGVCGRIIAFACPSKEGLIAADHT
jgi:hypothetical protein